jgi:glycosyltransferase involved in cell wall biosynthesis
MKILYIDNARIPTEKAHGIQIMKMCEAFVSMGHEVDLIISWRFNHIKDDPFEYYSIKEIFPIKRIFSIDLARFGKWGFIIQSFSFAIAAFFYTLFVKKDIVFGRDQLSLLFISLHSHVVWESHTGNYNKIAQLILKRCTSLIVITEGLRKFYIQKGVESKMIFTAPDGVDMKLFDIVISKEESRRKLNLPMDKDVALYAGHLYDWKGAHIFAEASRFLAENTLAVFVGGIEKDIKNFIKQFGDTPNILILGKKPYNSIPLYLKAADVLVMPNSDKGDISRLYTSPMKLFEYMASGRPIVASDLPSIREILNENNSVLVAPDSPQLLAKGIQCILTDNTLREKIQKNSYIESKRYTWSQRAKNIIQFILK